MDKKPVRIQRKRTKGYNMDSASRAINGLPCFYVGRPGIFGNPYQSPRDGTPEECVAKFEEYWRGSGNLRLKRFIMDSTLRGKNLSCFCATDQACHADVLLKIANEPTNG